MLTIEITYSGEFVVTKVGIDTSLACHLKVAGCADALANFATGFHRFFPLGDHLPMLDPRQFYLDIDTIQ